MEQYHSEIKTDMNVERLLSGAFATHDLVLQIALLTVGLLRVIGQATLARRDVPLRPAAQQSYVLDQRPRAADGGVLHHANEQ